MNIASLVLGIISILGCCTGTGMLVGIPCGIIGLILGDKYKKEVDENNSNAKAGVVCSKVGLGIAGAWIVFILILALSSATS